MQLSPDVVQFGSVFFAVFVKDFAVAAVVFSLLVIGKPKLVAPNQPQGACGKASGIISWAKGIYGLDLDAVRKAGGVDAELRVSAAFSVSFPFVRWFVRSAVAAVAPRSTRALWFAGIAGGYGCGSRCSRCGCC